MKNLRILFTTALVLAIVSSSFAQTFEVRAGLNLSTIFAKDDDDTYNEDSKLLPCVHAGGLVEIPIAGLFSVETGLFYSSKGRKDKQTDDNFDAEWVSTILTHNLDIPLNAKVTADLGGLGLYVTAGPYLGVGVAGKLKSKVTIMEETEKDSESIEWGSDPDEHHLKRLDYGVSFGGGVEINSITVGAGYALGLANLSPYTENGMTLNNRVLSISLGYKIGNRDADD